MAIIILISWVDKYFQGKCAYCMKGCFVLEIELWGEITAAEAKFQK